MCKNRRRFALFGRLLLFLIIYGAGAGGERRNSAQESDRFGRKRGDFAMEIMKFRFFLLVFSNKKHFFT